MGGGRRAPFGAGEREKALEAVRAVTQPKVCTSYHQATICLKVINNFHFSTRLDSTILRQSFANHLQVLEYILELLCKIFHVQDSTILFKKNEEET